MTILSRIGARCIRHTPSENRRKIAIDVRPNEISSKFPASVDRCWETPIKSLILSSYCHLSKFEVIISKVIVCIYCFERMSWF